MAAFRCKCKLHDCAYHQPVMGGTDADCDCQHTDKHHYPGQPCPLYRKDWAETSNTKAAELLQKFRGKGKL